MKARKSLSLQWGLLGSVSRRGRWSQVETCGCGDTVGSVSESLACLGPAREHPGSQWPRPVTRLSSAAQVYH